MNSESDPAQISLAFCFALVAGFTPTTSLHNLLILFIVLILRVNFSGFLLAFLFFSGLAYLLDPLFHLVGLKVLTAESLNSLWTAMYNSTIWRIERFNNSVVMGGFIVSLLLAIPLFFASNLIINKYREHLLAWVRKTRIMQFIRTAKIYRIYSSLSELRDKL